MKQFTIKIRILLSVVILLSLVLFGCSADTGTKETPTTTITANTITPTVADKPRLTSEEASSLILSGLSSKLPAGYKINQFDPDTRQVLYAGNGKWEFTIKGAGKEVTELPEEKVEKSEILWVLVKKEAVITFDLVLLADYFENTGICEIIYLNKKNEVTSTDIVSEREIEAKLKVKLIKLQYYANKLQVQVTLENTGYVPLNGIKMVTSYDKPVQEIAFKNYDGTLYPEQSTVLLNTYEDENILDFSYPNHLAFFTESNIEIPFVIDTNAYES